MPCKLVKTKTGNAFMCSRGQNYGTLALLNRKSGEKFTTLLSQKEFRDRRPDSVIEVFDVKKNARKFLKSFLVEK